MDGTRFRTFRAVFHVPEGVQDSHLALLLTVALASFFEEYDIATLTSALKHISASLRIEESTLPNVLGTIRLGALPAFALIPYADRVGRRRVFLLSVVAIGLFTFATAFARTQTEFVLFQMLTRTFFVAGSAVGFVIVAEEFPAAHRGFGIGLLGALAITGYGFSAMLFALVDHLPFGWRSLYVVGLTPVLLYPRLAKRVKETRRFEEHARSPEGARAMALAGWLTPLRAAWAGRPLRAIGIALGGLLPSFGIIGTFQFTGYFTQKEHGWSPQNYAALVIAAGGVGVIGNLVSGRLADRFGRRIVGAAQLASFPIFATIFYRGTGVALPLAWAGCVFTSQGGRAILRAQATELFPTRSRGAASGLFAILDVIGAAAGLFLLGNLVRGPGELARTIPWVAAVTALGAVVIFLFPETTNRELESLS